MESIALPLAEKARLLTGAGALALAGNEAIGLPAIHMSDGPHGVRRLIGHPSYPQECHIPGGDVCFPTPSALGATWNVELVRQVGAAIAEDCLQEDIQVLLAPGVNMKRSPACGRNFEYYSEDPVLSGELGAAFIQGVQSRGISACLKHFAANNQETDRSSISVEVDSRTLRELYLLPFEIAVKKGRPDSVMCAYNKLGAIWCSEHRWLLTQVLRNEWGFDGLVVSDWHAVHSPAKALAAGLDLQMPKDAHILEELQAGLESGRIREEQIDQAIRRLKALACKAAQSESLPQPYSREAQHRLAQKAAAEAVVLLKNEEELLPLQAGAQKTIAVFGSFADSPVIMGGGSSKVTVEEGSIDRPLEYIRRYAGEEAEVRYLPVFDRVLDVPAVLPEIKRCAEEADVSIVFLGNPQDYEAEETDRRSLDFPDYMNLCAETVCRACPNTVVVMQTGSCNRPGAWASQAKAILQMWYSGEGGGRAVADILFGETNPSGKLSETFFLEEPEYTWDFGNGRWVCYAEGPFVGYRYYDAHPGKIWYPFGHGLSYTRFAYTDLEIGAASVTQEPAEVPVSFTLTNTGERTGKEVWQLYIAAADSIARRPAKELKAFGKVELSPGETRRITVTLTGRDLAVYNPYLNGWQIENGRYVVKVGASCGDIRLQGELTARLAGGYTTHSEREAVVL